MKVTQYKLVKNGHCKIAVISDLHDTDCTDVIKTLNEVSPDLILAAGDIFERYPKDGLMPEISNREKLSQYIIYAGSHSLNWIYTNLFHKKVKTDKQNGYHFLEEANKIAPVFMSVGNHDFPMTEEDKKQIHATNTVLLDNQDTSITVKSRYLCIGGLSTFPDYEWLEKFSKTPGYKILMCHHPEYYMEKIKDAKYNTFHAVVSGHTHGGQWQIGNHGIYAPGQGLFPRYSYGRFDKLIISGGVSNTTAIPRFHNPCEIVILYV